MPKIVQVTPAQVHAAKLKIQRSTATGKPISSSVSAVANARRATDHAQPVRQSTKG